MIYGPQFLYETFRVNRFLSLKLPYFMLVFITRFIYHHRQSFKQYSKSKNSSYYFFLNWYGCVNHFQYYIYSV